MAIIYKQTPEQKALWENWKRSRPAVIRDLAERFPPNVLFRLKSTNQRCTIASYSEDGTMRVNITGEYNRVLFGRTVFGIDPTDLEECDLPAPGDDTGDTAAEAGYTEEDIRTILSLKVFEGEQ